jgi:stage V sporulation protein D (sporulation-specific penicillin-binding protein)
MARQREKAKVKKFKGYMQSKLLFVFIVILCAMIAIIARLVFLNNRDQERYEKRVLSQQTFLSSTLPYQRGSILDRNGVVLASSDKVYNVIIEPKVILTDENYLKPTVEALSTIFEVDTAEVTSLIHEKSTSSYQRLLKQVSIDVVDSFEKLQKQDRNIKGVWFEEEYKRNYPYGSLASHVIGYTSAGDVGTWGIEEYYNSSLNGTNGRVYGFYDSELNLNRTRKEAVNGYTIVSTIDTNVQRIVEEHIKKFQEEIGANNVSVIVSNPNNGEIYAMANNLGFDLNNPYDLSAYYDKVEIASMSDEDKEKALNTMWRNFSISDTYEPGSTIKPFTVASALEEHLITPETTFHCNGVQRVGGYNIRCNASHGTVTLAQSLMKSCNPSMMAIGEKEGASLFRTYQDHFFFGKKTGVDLPGESEGILIPADKLHVTELATSSFGQGFNVTMIQMVAGFASLVNGGHYYQPHVVKEIVTDHGTTVDEKEQYSINETVSAETSEFIREAMYLTVQDGTAKPAKVEGYLVGGKTGTAQKLPRTSKKYVVSFIGCVPTDDPKVVIFVVIDEVHDETKKASSTVATTLTSQILKDILPFLEVYPEGEIEYKVELPVIKDGEEGQKGEGQLGEQGSQGNNGEDNYVGFDDSQADAIPDIAD